MTETNAYLKKVIKGQALSQDDIQRALQIMALGGATPAQISALLTALMIKGYDANEIAGVIHFISMKCKKISTAHQNVFIAASSKHADSWICASVILAHLKVPTFLQFYRDSDMHIAQVLGINLNMNDDEKKHLLDELNLCISYIPKPKALRNIIPVQEELEMDTIIDVIYPIAPIQNTTVVVAEDQSFYDLERLAEGFKLAGYHNLILFNKNKSFVTDSSGALVKDKLIHHYEDEHHHSLHELTSRANSFMHAGETRNQNDIFMKTAEILKLYKATESYEEGVKLAAAAHKDGKLYQKLQKLVLLSNALSDG